MHRLGKFGFLSTLDNNYRLEYIRQMGFFFWCIETKNPKRNQLGKSWVFSTLARESRPVSNNDQPIDGARSLALVRNDVAIRIQKLCCATLGPTPMMHP